MKLVGIPLRKEIDVVVHTGITRFLQKQFPKKKIVTYMNTETQRMCVGIWRNRLLGMVHEITSYGPNDPFDRQKLAFMRYWFSGQRMRDRNEQIKCARMGRQRHMSTQSAKGRDHKERLKSYLKSRTIHQRDNPDLLGALMAPGTLNWR